MSIFLVKFFILVSCVKIKSVIWLPQWITNIDMSKTGSTNHMILRRGYQFDWQEAEQKEGLENLYSASHTQIIHFTFKHTSYVSKVCIKDLKSLDDEQIWPQRQLHITCYSHNRKIVTTMWSRLDILCPVIYHDPPLTSCWLRLIAGRDRE